MRPKRGNYETCAGNLAGTVRIWRGRIWRGAGDYRASQAIRATMRLFSGAYIGHSADFLKRVAGFLPEKFPRAGSRSVRRCRAFVWELPCPDLLKVAA